jgi:hypothetical protein
MAQTYDQSADLMTDMKFRGRVKVACLNFATYIAGELPTETAHNSRYKWSQQCFQQPDMTAQGIQSAVVTHDLVQAAGSSITDVDLQTAVEATVNKLI